MYIDLYLTSRSKYCLWFWKVFIRPSMCTRLLYTVLPSPYTQQSFHRLLSQLTKDLNSLQEPGVDVPSLHHFLLNTFEFTTVFVWGLLQLDLVTLTISQVEWEGQKYHFRFICIGCKGDWPFLRSAYSLSCGYNCTAKCHRCDVRDTSPYIYTLCI